MIKFFRNFITVTFYEKNKVRVYEDQNIYNIMAIKM